MFNNKYTGIDFRDHQVTFASVKLDKQAPVLEEVYDMPLGENIVSDGVVLEKGLLSSVLHTYLKENKSRSKHVHLAIPTENTLIRKLTMLPDLEERDLAKLIQFQIGETIHIPFEDPIYDFVKVGSILPVSKGIMQDEDFTLEDLTNNIEKDIQGQRSEILFFATSKPVSQKIMETCEDAGFKPHTAEVRGLSLQRLLMYLHPSWLKGTEMILDVTEETVDIHIFKNEMIVFSRTMAIEAVDYSQPLASDEDVLAFTDNSVIETRSQVAATVDTTWDEADFVSAVVNEIQKAQNFFRYSLGERDSEFSRIILTGESAYKLAGLLSERMETEISRIDYSSILAHDGMNQQLLDTCSVAIGLALRTNDKPSKRRKAR